MRLVFRFPMPANLTNAASGRSHWRVKHGEKQKFYSVCDLMQKAGLLPPAPEQPFSKVVLSSVMYLGAHMDDDNALARHKSVLDWLKTRGYLVEDRKKNIRWAGLPEQVVKRKQQYAIEITLTEEAVSRSEAT